MRENANKYWNNKEVVDAICKEKFSNLWHLERIDDCLVKVTDVENNLVNSPSYNPETMGD